MIDTNLLDRRINHRHFLKKKPSKKIIESILQEAINTSPVKGEYFPYKLSIFGPEWSEEKRLMAYDAVANKEMNLRYYLNHDRTEQQWEEDIKEYYNTHRGQFNAQIEAPYVIAVVEDKDRWNPCKADYPKYMTDQASGILMYGITLAANRHELDAAFCLCMDTNKKSYLNRMVKEAGGHTNKPVMYPQLLGYVGIGYYDWSTGTSEKDSGQFRRDGDVVEHMNGGKYNIKTGTREGYKGRKPDLYVLVEWKPI